MALDYKPARRLTLRQLLTQAEKCSRDLIEHFRTTYLSQVSDFRDLSRPVRRRSHYPKMLAMQNALKKLIAAQQEAQEIAEQLHEQMDVIRDHASKERLNRIHGG
jgi:hypothetical protein